MAADLSAYTETVALVVGGAFILAVLGYAVVTRSAGREGDERAHEKAVHSGLEKLAHSEQAVTAEPDRGFVTDLEFLAKHRRSVGRLTRVQQWCRRRLPRGLVAHGRVIEDADGQPIHVVSVNGRRLAHRELETLIGDAKTVIAALTEHDTPPATMSERYYQDIVDGFVDLDDTRSRVRGDCQLRVEANMRRNESLDRQELFDRLVYDRGFRYPPEVVAEKLDELEGRVLRQRTDGTVTYQRFS